MSSAIHCTTKRRFLMFTLLFVVLVGCGDSTRASQTSATIRAPSTSASLPATKQPTRLQAATPSIPATSAPLPSAALAASAVPPELVNRLPLNQPWVWTPTNACNYRAGVVIAVSGAGLLQQFSTPVAVVVERPTLPPVLITCADDGTFALVATDTWTSTPLAIPARTLLQSFLVSPDGSQLAFNAAPDATTIATQKADKQLVQIVNIQTGALRTIIDSDTLHRTPLSVDSPYGLIEPVGWHDQTIYTHMQVSATSEFWRVDLAQEPPIIHKELHIGATGLWAASPVGNALVWAESYDHPSPRLRNLATGHEQALDGATDAAFSPDGTVVASIRTSTDRRCCEIVFMDMTDGSFTMRSQSQPVGAPSMIQGRRGLQWSRDGRSVIVPTQAQPDGPIQVLVLTDKGREIGNVSLPQAVIDDLRLMQGDQLVLIIREGERSLLGAIALHTNDSPHTLPTVLPNNSSTGGLYSLAHVP